MKSLLALICITLLLTGCASYIDYGNGRYGVTRVSEERSPFGTNAGFALLDNCKGVYSQEAMGLVFTDCQTTLPPHLISSQGVGGQIVGGALTGLGFGLGNAFSGATSSATSTQSVITAPAKGSHY